MTYDHSQKLPGDFKDICFPFQNVLLVISSIQGLKTTLFLSTQMKRLSLIHMLLKRLVMFGHWQCVMRISCFSLPLSSGLFQIQLTPPQPYLFGHIAHCPQDCCWKLSSLTAWLLLTINATANTLQSPLSLNWLNNKLAFTAVMIHL